MRRTTIILAVATALAAGQIGELDTIGGTYYDWQNGWSAWRTLCNSTGNGVYAVWLYSNSDQTTFPDRGMRMNFYDYATRRWVAIDTSDYMNSGYPVFGDRNGFGMLDVDTVGQAYVSAHLGVVLGPVLARELGHGSGLFEFSTGPEEYLWPAVAVTANGWMHVAAIDDASRDRLYWTRSRSWGTWDTPMHIPDYQPDPMGPRHNIAASKVSDRVCVTWEYSMGSPDPGYYRESSDGGETWGEPTELPPPDAYGGDTVTSYHITSLFPYYDREDRLHVVTPVMPYVDGQGYIVPAQIWHWCRGNNPPWHRIRWAGCHPENLLAPVGYNALYACRPSIGQDRFGSLHVVWEEFDSSNVEPGPPEYLRADAFWSTSADNGYTWGDAVKLTERGTASHRFPCVMDRMQSDGGDHLRVIYMVDLKAGFFVQGEDNPTPNPVVVQSIPLTGIEEELPTVVSRSKLPTVLRAPELARLDGRILDPTGRDVTDERHTLSPGVYLCQPSTGSASAGRKVILTR